MRRLLKKDARSDIACVLDPSVYSKRNIHHISGIWGLIVLLTVFILSLITRHNLRENLPNAIRNSDLLEKSDVFIADQAYKNLKILTSFGARPTGSYNNEVLAVDFLKQQISLIKQAANVNQRIALDVQIVSGAFWTGFKPYGMTSVYRNVQNVVAYLYGENITSDFTNSSHSLLLNCHFDTVAGSPGASDDALNCVVMLEILRIMSQKSERNKHNIIFLFNGAEETGLQASHGFITKHQWAKSVRAFINLEAVGSGGKELLFQCSPNNSWLVKMYGKAARYPSAQVAAEEIFYSGLIPSDTDFRIFQQFGGIPGMDFAHFINGYRYHTKFDNVAFISKSVLQHTGENILELTKAIANSDELGKIKEIGSKSQVYYDFLGFVFINYSENFGVIINYLTGVFSVIAPYIMLSRVTKGINKKHLRYEIFLGFLVNMTSLVFSNAVNYAIAYELDAAGKSMSWYSSTFLCLVTYCVPTIFVECGMHLIFNRSSKSPLSLALQTQARLIGTSLFWGILAAALTGAGIRTAYTIVVPLLITLTFNLITGLMHYPNTIRMWLYVHLVGQILVVLWCSNLFYMILEVFIPTAGRSGAQKNPDTLIAIICSSLTLLITSYLTPLIILLKSSRNFHIALFAICIVSRFYFIPHTNFGFPYTNNANGEPKVQRHYITHAIRTLYDKEGNIRYTDSGFWLAEQDRNARKTLESLTLPEEIISQEKNILCQNEVFCGLPIYSTWQLKTGGFWVSGPPPEIREHADLKLISREQLSSKLHRLKFMISGSFMLSLQIWPKNSVHLKKWSILAEVPPKTTYKDCKSYFIMISHGKEADPLNITLDLQTPDDHDDNRSLLDITLVTYHMEHHKEHTSVFVTMLSKLPSWTHAVPFVASLKSWTF